MSLLIEPQKCIKVKERIRLKIFTDTLHNGVFYFVITNNFSHEFKRVKFFTSYVIKERKTDVITDKFW